MPEIFVQYVDEMRYQHNVPVPNGIKAIELQKYLKKKFNIKAKIMVSHREDMLNNSLRRRLRRRSAKHSAQLLEVVDLSKNKAKTETVRFKPMIHIVRTKDKVIRV